MTTEVLKLEVEAESCCICGNNDTELFTPEEHDAEAPVGQAPLRAMLLQLSNTKMLPEGRLCSSCVQRTLEAYEFSSTLSSKGAMPLSEKIRALRKRLHELTQKVDVFIVVGGPGTTDANSYNEEDIIMVDKSALAAAAKADDDDLERARNARGDTVYQCTVCPASFQHISEYRSHVSSHGAECLHSCWTCGAQFSTRIALQQHAAQHNPTHHLHCNICDSTFQSESHLRRHEVSCVSQCPVCRHTCKDRTALSEHVTLTHGEQCAPPHVCSVCYTVYEDAELLSAHVLTHRQAKQFVCGYDSCILRFADRNSLMSHIRKAHTTHFQHESNEATHSAMSVQHTGTTDTTTITGQTVPCQYCTRSFGSVAAMKRHVRVHRTASSNTTPTATATHENNDQLQHNKLDYTIQEEEQVGEVEYLEVEDLEYLMDDKNDLTQHLNIN